VGAVVGVGLVQGMQAISKKTIMTILLGWLLTPTFAAAASFLLYKLIKTIFA
jgi:phosphate/sulfate permease